MNNPRALGVEQAAEAVVGLGYAIPETASDIREALLRAKAETPPGGLICVTGSLFLAAEARAAILGL